MNYRALYMTTVLLAAAGVFIAIVTGVAHLGGAKLPCGGLQSGCDVIALPENSHWFGIPIAFYGAALYGSLLVLGIARLRLGVASAGQIGRVVRYGATLGCAVSIALILYGFFALNATCLWCLASAATMTLICGIEWLGSRSPVAEAAVKPRTDWLVGLGVVAALGGYVYGSAFEDLPIIDIVEPPPGESKAELIARLIGDGRHVYGDPNAEVTIVEFSDLFCPTCANQHTWLKAQIDGSLSGRAKLVLRHFPIRQQHPQALRSAVAAEMVSQQAPDRFWEFIELHFKNQEDDSSENLARMVAAVELDADEAMSMLSDRNQNGKFLEKVQADLRDATQSGVVSTPHFFLIYKDENGDQQIKSAIAGAIRGAVDQIFDR